MKTLARSIILTLFSLLVNNCSYTQVNRNTSLEFFVQFKMLFQEIELPINWSRQDIGKFAMPSYGQSSVYNEIPPKFFSFIPEDVIETDSTTYIRALFQLPHKNDMHLMIIVTDFMYDRYKDGELYSILTKLYLIGYDSSGQLLFHKMIAGNYVDRWDKLFQFNVDYSFQTKHYLFLNETLKHPSKNKLIEKMRYTETLFQIVENELSSCSSKTMDGYFDHHSNGDYELVIGFKGN